MTGSEVHSSLPTFVVIGAMKAGATTLHAWLDTRPDICVSPRDGQVMLKPVALPLLGSSNGTVWEWLDEPTGLISIMETNSGSVYTGASGADEEEIFEFPIRVYDGTSTRTLVDDSGLSRLEGAPPGAMQTLNGPCQSGPLVASTPTVGQLSMPGRASSVLGTTGRSRVAG